MSTTVIVGAQWGDEGKGKIIDILASRSQVVIRSQGGNNAGHTVKNKGEVYKLHLVPSGILYPHTQNLIGCGVVIDPQSFLGEIDGLRARGIPCDNLKIDARAHIVMPWHLLLDALSEEARGDTDIGTTRRGIGPCYMDKAERCGLRLYDICHPKELRKKVLATGKLKNDLLTNIYGHAPVDLEAVITQYTTYGQRLAAFMDDVSVLAFEAIQAGKPVLFEGAQGTLLDLDVGTYPFVTSSHPVSGGVCAGTGIGPTAIDQVIGVSKAYTTRVGKGPFPTELHGEIGDKIRELGYEYGTTTGRPRRVGWFDAVILRHAVRVNGLSGLAVNKLDTLSGFDTLRICTAYKKADGTLIREFPPAYEELGECEPIYEDIKGFHEDITGCRRFVDLPKACKAYIERIEAVCGCPVTMVGVGPARDQNLER